MAAETGHSDAICVLHELGANVDVANHDGNTPLHKAASEGHAVGIRVLGTEFFANPVAKNKEGNTPLHLAASRNNTAAARVLVEELGAFVDAAMRKPMRKATPLSTWQRRLATLAQYLFL